MHQTRVAIGSKRLFLKSKWQTRENLTNHGDKCGVDMVSNTINNAVTMPGGEGALLSNRYRIVRQLGQGGMKSLL